ncbi:hypothetical protein PT2222_540005 [Paraburkholderia tropica]
MAEQNPGKRLGKPIAFRLTEEDRERYLAKVSGGRWMPADCWRALARSHGLIASKYEVTKGRDGSDRIQCGVRNLNVSDFLTKEMHLP